MEREMRISLGILLVASSMAAGFAFGMPGVQNWIFLAGGLQGLSAALLLIGGQGEKRIPQKDGE
jgi:hypothetical protein